MSRFRTVLIDDAVDLRRLLRAALESAGRFEIVGEAGDGREGVSLVSEHQPDLVLLDLSMPVMDGLEALPLLRGAAPDATIVVLSGHPADMTADRVLSSGAAAYLEKGLRPTPMVEALLRALDREDETEVARPSVEPPETLAVIGQLAHDLRTPLATAMGFLDLVSRTVDEDSDAATYAERATVAVERLHRLVSGTLTYARDGHRSLSVQDAVDLAVVVEHTVHALETDHPDAARRVTVTGPGGATVRADEVALERVAQNLLKNALAYSSGPVAVRIEPAEGRPTALVILDEGPGLIPSDIDAVFVPFRRGAAGRDVEGSGLGLALSARLVQQMGGQMSARNREDGVQGAEFRVELMPGATAPTPDALDLAGGEATRVSPG